MINQAMGNGGDFELPQQLLEVLPSDPYEQLDVARKITSMAIASRVSKLESEATKLRQKLAEKEQLIYGLQERLVEAEQTLQETTTRLSHALDDQAKLTSEKNVLVATVKKLNRDVAKLETFKRTLMQSLQEDEEAPAPVDAAEKVQRASVLSGKAARAAEATRLEDEVSSNGVVAIRPIVVASRSTTGASDLATQGASQGPTRGEDSHGDADVLRSTSHPQRAILSLTPTLTPQLTPTGSPRRKSAAGSPRRASAAGSPRWHSASEARVPLLSSQPSSNATTAPNSPPPAGSMPARTPRVDGKEFFRQARNRLTYEQFSAFLANIKELNAHRQTREETLRKADETFGPENKDLYIAFDGLLSRHLPT